MHEKSHYVTLGGPLLSVLFLGSLLGGSLLLLGLLQLSLEGRVSHGLEYGVATEGLHVGVESEHHIQVLQRILLL